MEPISDFFKSALFFIVATFGVNVGTDEPKYRVIEMIDQQTEIRLYAPRLAAEIHLSKTAEAKMESMAFGKLAAYIFGENKRNTKIDMTAPVEKSAVQQNSKIAMTAPVDVKKDQQSMTMRFFMPSEYHVDNLPEPTDKDIKIIKIPEQIIAVRKYSGFSNDDNVKKQQEDLMSALKLTEWKTMSDYRSYFYNPPWTIPFLRHNEILVEVKK